MTKGMVKRFANALILACFPGRCAACNAFMGFSEIKSHATDRCFQGQDIGSVFKTYASPCLCSKCLDGFTCVESPLCTRCGVVFKTRKGKDHVCGQCIETPPYYETARAVGIYEEALKAMIVGLKYKGKTRFAPVLSRILHHRFADLFKGGEPDFIAPVPLHFQRLRKRGFNQSYLIIKDWPEHGRENVKGGCNPKVEMDLLKRTRKTPPQTGLSRKDRSRNVKNAFSLNTLSCVKDQYVLLVDDVFTTGATVNECARVLVKNGARKVDVLTLARAV